MGDGLGARHEKVRRVRGLVVRRSARRDEGVLVAEGASLVAAALDAGAAVEGLYAAPEAQAACADLLARAGERGIAVHHLGPGVMERLAGTVNPQPVLAIVAWQSPPIEALASADLVVVAVDIRDPGNAGTLLRSAEAAGADGVVLCAGSVEAGNPKVVRSSAGAIFHVPVVEAGDPRDALAALAAAGFRTVAAVARGGVPHWDADWRGRVAIVLGNEARGLPETIVSSLDGAVTIPVVGRSESLNVGMAASVLLFEACRQRGAA